MVQTSETQSAMRSVSPLIPREVLLGNPKRVNPSLSPDGRRLAFVAPLDGVLNLFVRPLDGDDADAAPVTHDTGRGIRSYGWAHDNRHLVYIQDRDGDENWRLYALDLEDGNRVIDLVVKDGVQVQFVAFSKKHPHEFLVGVNDRIPQLHDAYKVDLRTGSVELVAENPGYLSWVVDNDMNVRGGWTMTEIGGVMVIIDGKPVFQAEPADALTTGDFGFTPDGLGLYLLTAKGANAARLVRLDLANSELSEIIGDPVYDLAGVRIDPDTREVITVVIIRDRMELLAVDPSYGPDIAALRSRHHGDVGLLNHDDGKRRWLVAYNRDNGAVAYYLWDRDTQQETFLFEHRDDLHGYKLADMEPFSFTSRDGLTIHGYLTFPVDVERRGLPGVLFVHGGPWHRDTWGFNPDAQWLANRGYVSVQVNFRGSTGYGKDFVNAGDREWGGRMHDDLVDAVAHVVQQGWVDPNRVAIYGGSYGGFAALTGATATPDLFACAVALCGPSNLITFINALPEYWKPMLAMLHARVGNPETDAEFLRERSPLSHVDRIRIPMLIAQGGQDPRVVQAESEQIVEAMKARGIPHRYVLYEDEGHGFVRPEHRLEFYAIAEEFLSEHLGGRLELAPESPD
jgi:dipeptidyl aminopeptidase/acylaminoacyl peptidase